MEAGISSLFPSPSLLLLNMYYGRKHVLGSSCASRILGWNRSQECQGWDLERPRKSTRSAGLGSWKSESSSELDQQLSLWVILHTLPPPTHTHTHHSGLTKGHSCRMGKWLCHPDKTKNWTHSFSSIENLLFQGFGYINNQNRECLTLAQLLFIGLVSDGSWTGGPLALSSLLRK